MTTEAARVKKTGYRSKKVKGRNAAHDKVHMTKRTLADFPAPRRIDDGKHMIDDSVKLIKGVWRSGVDGGWEGEFCAALPGEYGVYKGDYCLNGKRHCIIKLMHVTAYLVDDGTSFEWI